MRRGGDIVTFEDKRNGVYLGEMLRNRNEMRVRSTEGDQARGIGGYIHDARQPLGCS